MTHVSKHWAEVAISCWLSSDWLSRLWRPQVCTCSAVVAVGDQQPRRQSRSAGINHLSEDIWAGPHNLRGLFEGSDHFKVGLELSLGQGQRSGVTGRTRVGSPPGPAPSEETEGTLGLSWLSAAAVIYLCLLFYGSRTNIQTTTATRISL